MMNEENDEIPETSAPDADENEMAKLAAENAELKHAARLSAARELMTDSLRSAGARTPRLLFDAAAGDLQYADDGSLANAAAMVERLKTQFPEQFGPDRPAASIDGGAGRAASPALTREALAKMSPAEIARLDWAAVRNVLSNG